MTDCMMMQNVWLIWYVKVSPSGTIIGVFCVLRTDPVGSSRSAYNGYGKAKRLKPYIDP